MSRNIAYVETDLTQSEVVGTWIKSTNSNCALYNSAYTAISGLTEYPADIILIDDTVDDKGGLDVLTHLRCRLHRPVTVVMIYNHFQISNTLTALRIGADDFLIKPLNKETLLSYLNNLTKTRNREPSLTNCDPYQFNTQKKDILLHGDRLHLSANEYSLAAYLFFFRNRIVLMDELAREILHEPTADKACLVEHRMIELKRRLHLKEAAPVWRLQTLRGIGYRLHFDATATLPTHSVSATL